MTPYPTEGIVFLLLKKILSHFDMKYITFLPMECELLKHGLSQFMSTCLAYTHFPSVVFSLSLKSVILIVNKMLFNHITFFRIPTADKYIEKCNCLQIKVEWKIKNSDFQ